MSEQKDRWRFSIHTYIIHMSIILHSDLLKLARRTPLLHTLHEQKKNLRKFAEVYRNSQRIIGIFMDIHGFLEGDDGVGNRGVKCEMIGYRYFIE